MTNIVEIQAIDPLYLEFCVPQIYTSFLKLGTPLTFEIDGIESKNLAAQIDLLYPSLDETTRSLRCRAVIANEQCLLRPGSLARIKIKIKQITLLNKETQRDSF
ncbi:MAG: efflux RND transporter periplasmic adaptor subunit [Parachlamydiaceae bacterium]|nr:MAG: efflux RND transporter periplasmic adaptor subunit [Parachlamydiaceae bacterium]